MLDAETTGTSSSVSSNLGHLLTDFAAEPGAMVHRDPSMAGGHLDHPLPLLTTTPKHLPDRAWAIGGLAPWQMSKLRHHIAENLCACLTNAALAQVARLSVGHFARSFRISFGMSPPAYVRSTRLTEAQRLMMTSDIPLSQIALACGLSDQAHFCRVFRRNVGESPAAWRAQRR